MDFKIEMEAIDNAITAYDKAIGELKGHISRLEFLNSMLKDAREKLDALVTEGEQL